MKKQGISLIVLVVTIVVIIILAGAVILSLVQNNPIDEANEASFKQELKSFDEKVSIEISKEYISDQNIINKKITDIDEIYKYLPELERSKYSNKVYITEGRLILKKSEFTEKEIEWAIEANLRFDDSNEEVKPEGNSVISVTLDYNGYGFYKKDGNNENNEYVFDIGTENFDKKFKITIEAKEEGTINKIKNPDGTIVNGSSSIFLLDNTEIDKELVFEIFDNDNNITKYKYIINTKTESYQKNSVIDKNLHITVNTDNADIMFVDASLISRNKDQPEGESIVQVSYNYEVNITGGKWYDDSYPEYGLDAGDFEELKAYLNKDILKNGVVEVKGRAQHFPEKPIFQLNQNSNIYAQITKYKLVEVK